MLQVVLRSMLLNAFWAARKKRQSSTKEYIQELFVDYTQEVL
jgi:hypothetical protein